MSPDDPSNTQQLEACADAMKDIAIEDSMDSFEVDESEIVIPPQDPREQEKYDRQMVEAVNLFFSNEFDKAQHLFNERATQDPIYALGIGGIQLIKALMTFNQQDIEQAMKALDRTDSIASAQLSKYAEHVSFAQSVISAGVGAVGGILRITGILSKKEEQVVLMSNGELRAHVIKAEANLLASLLNLFQESIMGFVRAGLRIRRGYKSYSKAWTEYIKLKETDFDQYDIHTVGGIEFGIGATNTALSMLPAKILNLISFLGIKSDGKLGLELLHKSMKRRGMRSGLASLFLLAIYQIQVSFSPHIYGEQVLEQANQVLEEALDQFPKSALHLLMAARIERGRRNLKKSTELLKVCNESQSAWKELNRFCCYEMGMNAAFELDFETAAKCMEELYDASYWSKAFYCYFYAACLDMQASTTQGPKAKEYKDKAIELYKKAPEYVNRKIAGRTIGVEQYVLRKVNIFQKDFSKTNLPIVELIGIWNGFRFMSKDKLEQVKQMILKTLKECDECEYWSETELIERTSTLHMSLGSVYRELGEYQLAKAEFDWVFSNEKLIKEEKLVVPFSYYEQAILYYLQGDLKGCRTCFQRVKDKYKDYNFEFRLETRIHLSLLKMDEEK